MINTLNELFNPIAPAVTFDSTDNDYDFNIITPTNSDEFMLTNWQHQGLVFGQHIFVLDGKNEWYIPPFTWEWIQDQLVITSVLNDSLDINVGDIVTKIEDQSSLAYFDEIKSRISAGTPSYLNNIASVSSLLGRENSSINVQVNGRTLRIKRSHDASKKYKKSFEESYKLLNEDIMYLDLTNIGRDKIETLIPQLERAKALIFDGRGYIQSKNQFLRHFLTRKDTSSSWHRVPRVIYPDQEKSAGYKAYSWELKPKDPYLGDKIIIYLINGKAISASESYLSFVEHYNLGLLLGEQTAGTNGAATSFTLLGGITIRWTGSQVLKHDGSQHHCVGILPDVYVSKTIDGLKAGKDEYLEKAIQIINEKLKSND